MTNEGAIATPYDVFLSYSSDTRNTFTANLYNALRDKRIKTFFMDDDKLFSSGNQLTSPSILNALEESIISIVVLSKDYAHSMRCLDQLVKIIDCMKSRGQLVWPIFYGVDPSDVRHERSYAQAMVANENMFKEDHKKVLEWRSALSEVTNLDDGWLFKIGQQDESELIQKVVERVAECTPSNDVFLSFSEKDSRYSFTSFLYNALEQEGFKTLMNDEGLEDGDQIPLSIMKAIERSKFFIIVLSENYAYSSSRLDQLVRILDSRKMTNQLVWPIFYKVEPTEVRHQKNSYCEAMKAHEYRLGEGSKKVQKWRLALKHVANLKGWSLKTRYEYKFIQEIMAVMKLPPAHWSYDVFVSFSRKDTHQSFMNNLDYVLRRRGIMTFMDDGEFKSGHSISHSDSKEALEESRISIVVLSPDYAYSTWCLNKLVEILDCRKRKNQLVWPIFYNVEPTDVRHQKNSYRKAMAAHKNRFREDFEKVQKWRSALSEVANLEGWQWNTGEGIKIIERIVEFAVEFLFIDVFLSFSGEDTRYSFTGFLYYALRQEEFKTFMDDEGLKGGDEISETLIKTIKQSRLSIIIFSENYAYSSWCLDELVKIIECKNLNKQLVLPIFYKVEKSDVCNQEKSYGDAMAEHGNIYGNDSEKVQKWRSALSDVANLEGGEHIKENESEYEFIKKIVGIVRARLSTGVPVIVLLPTLRLSKRSNEQIKSNQHDNPVDSGNVAVKRSRARKYPRPDEEGSKYIMLNPRTIHNIEGDDNALVPPGFEAAVQQPQSRETLKFELTNVVEEGQEISVVVDRIYRDGYWVSFKDVNSGRTLRGLICDTKHYFPVVDENKVTLGVPMLPKHIAPFLPKCLTQVPKSEVMTQASQGRGKRVLNDIPIVSNSSNRKKIEIIDLEEEELEEELDQPMPMHGFRSLEHSASASTSSKMTKFVQDEQSGEPKGEELGTELDDGGSTGQSNK